VSPELMRFHRHEQMKKLRAIFRTLLRLKKINNFSLLTARSNFRTEGRRPTTEGL
jgi:hypothetical protein